MKKISSRILLWVLLVGLQSCGDDLLDVNTDPLLATEDQFSNNPELLFTRIQVELGAERVLESGNVFLLFAQQADGAGSAGVFTAPGQYVVPDFPQIVSWGTYYINLLKNVVLGIQLADQGNQPNISGVYKIMRAFIFYHITMTWESAPYSEANSTEIQFPTFDDQETILRGLLVDLDDAIATFDPTDAVIMNGGQDFIYNGDINSWIRFANSLKLKILMAIVNRDATVAGQIDDLVNNQPLVDENEYNAILSYGSEITNANQLWKLHNQFAGGTSAFYNGTTTIINLLDGSDGAGDGTGGTADDDPRLSTYFDEGTTAASGQFNGVFPGSVDNLASYANLSLNVIREEEGDRWMMADYINLLKAEAISRGFATGDAEALYRKGVTQSMQSYDGRPGSITSGAINSYVATLPTPSLSDIHNQQYLAVFMRGMEAWTQVRRTGIFNGFPLPNNAQLSDKIRRLPYAPDARTTNPNTPVDPVLTSKMWFEPN